MDFVILMWVLLIILLLLIWPRFINQAEYWPTSVKRCRKMLKMADLKKGEKFYDLGCGDGRFLIIAEKEFGANATGIEIDPIRYAIAKILVFLFTKKAKVIFGNYNKHRFNDANVISVFLQTNPMKEFEKSLHKLKKGTRIVSHYHRFEKIKPSKTDRKEKIYLYAVK